MADDPQAAGERREAARHLVQNPLLTLERDPDRFRLVRRHETELDRWFTQRLGYRLHVDGDTARLYKTGYVPDHRPLRTASGRPFHRREYVLLALVLAATAAGPDVISLRDLVDQVRSAAAEAGIALTDDSTERRALVSVLSWMIDRGLATELHAHVDAYATDRDADAVLKLRPDRIVLLALPALTGAPDAGALLAQAERRTGSRQWMRARLVEDPVLYRSDLTEAEWGELRRRLGGEAQFLDEMFGLLLEARAEGVAAIDPTGSLTETRFPTSGTVGHAALLLIDALAPGGADGAVPLDDVRAALAASIHVHRTHWSQALLDRPDKLLAEVLGLLVRLRLAELVGPATGASSGHELRGAPTGTDAVRAQPDRGSASPPASGAPAGQGAAAVRAAPPPDGTATAPAAASDRTPPPDDLADTDGGTRAVRWSTSDPATDHQADLDPGAPETEERAPDESGVAAIAAALGRGAVVAVRLLPAANRFVSASPGARGASGPAGAPADDGAVQSQLW